MGTQVTETQFVELINKFEGFKRIESFHSEAFFQKELSEHFTQNSLAFNWLHTGSNKSRIFIKLLGIAGGFRITRCDRLFIQKLFKINNSKKERHKIIIVRFNEEKQDFTAFTVASIDKNLNLKSEESNEFRASDLLKPYSKKKEKKKYNGAENKGKTKFQTSLLFKSMSALGLHLDLYYSRKFINQVFIPIFGHQPSDIDAIVSIKSEAHILEFKRKGPAFHTLRKLDRSYSVDVASDYKATTRKEIHKAINIAKQISEKDWNSLDPIKRKQLTFKAIKNNQIFDVDETEPVYGLDYFPHSNFVRWLSVENISHWSIIWDRAKVKSQDFIDLDCYKFKGQETILLKKTTPTDFIGFTFTNDVFSGMNKKLRLQEVSLQSAYEQIRESSGLANTLNRIERLAS